ncbi:MAG: DUF3422 domain-containing protein [Burkholderiales bacterium]|nr:DUF3422 domain-containing protein [Burkholderiales bacterium]
MNPTSLLLAAEHPLRRVLADEVHARPSESIESPSRASTVAVLVDAGDRQRELEHLARLCALWGVAPPAAEASHFSSGLGELKLRWERHGEFSSYTFFLSGAEEASRFASAVEAVPAEWLHEIPGLTLAAAHAELVEQPPGGIDNAFLARYFGGNVVIGSDVGEGAAAAFTDFRVSTDGFLRFLLVDTGCTPRQAGRMLQRLFEIETYRMMALLALPVARKQSSRLASIEAALASVTADIAAARGDDETLLHEVTRLAAEVESGLGESQFRFNACRAYGELVATRIGELRERRLPGIQPIGEFMTRRFSPALATCATVAQRLQGCSERVARASALLSTRVDIASERQNQFLLASMDRRAKMQLRLQQTVEGLSVAAIVYYASGLVGYLAKGLHHYAPGLEPELVVALSIPLLAVAVLASTRAARRRIYRDDPEARDA